MRSHTVTASNAFRRPSARSKWLRARAICSKRTFSGTVRISCCWLNVLARCHCNESLLWGSQLNVACGPWLSVPRSKEFDRMTCALIVEAQPNNKAMRTSRSLIRQGSQDRSCRASLVTKTSSVQHTPAGQLTTFGILLLLVDVA